MAHRALQTGQGPPRVSATHTSCAHSSRSHLRLRLKSAQAASQRRSAATAQLRSAAHLHSRNCAAATRRAAVTVLASSDGPGSGNGGNDKAAPSATLVIPAAAAGLAVLTTAALTLWREPLEDLLYGDGLGGAADWGAGDIAGGLLWALALYYCSPLQLLLVFLGKFDTERPSDAVLRLIGKAAGLRVDDVDYLRPAWVQGAAVATFVLAGGAMSWAFSAALGDATWAVSSGIGACMAAGLFEVGRPRRLSRDEAVVLEAQWQDFARFAGVRLQRTGRCHETEVFGAFRREYARYRNPETVPDTVLRDMVRNWNPDVDRTRTGYLKGVSLLPRIDAFTGEVTGYQAAVGARATGSTISNGAEVSQQEQGA